MGLYLAQARDRDSEMRSDLKVNTGLPAHIKHRLQAVLRRRDRRRSARAVPEGLPKEGIMPARAWFLASCCLLLMAALVASSCVTVTPAPTREKPTATPREPYEIAVVLRITGVPWFSVMEAGVNKAARELGENAYAVGPKSTDPALQVALVEELIAKGVDAIAVIPNDAASLEPVFQRARDKGIVVLTHESANQVGNDYDLETIDNVRFAERHWDALVECMGTDSGDYGILVGSLDEPTHNLWADAGLRYAAEKYPGLTLVGDRIPAAGDQALARQKVLDLIAAHPNLRGVIGFGVLGPPGAAQAVKQKGLADRICVVGTVVPSHAAPFLKDGSLDRGFLWNPADAGYGLVWLAQAILDGKKIANGLEIPGLGPITVDGKVVRTDAMIEINRDNVDTFGF